MKSPIWENIFKGWNKEKESDTVLTLKQIPIFADLTEKEFTQIEKIIHKRNYKPKEFIFKESAPGVGMYIIMKGSVDIVLNSSTEDETILATMKEGNFFGELTLLDEKPRSAAAVSRENSVILGFFRPDLLDLLKRKPSFGIKILLNLASIIGDRLRDTNETLEKMRRGKK